MSEPIEMDEWDTRREQKRQAQARYRKTHADELRIARRVAQLLVRQQHYPGDPEELAAAIRSLAGQEFAHTLGQELMRARGRKRKAC